MMRRRIQQHPLIPFALAVVGLFAMYSVLPRYIKHPVDVVLVLALSLSFSWAAVLMVRQTRIWTERGMGLLGTVTGDALLYLAIGFGTALGFRTQVLDLARACLTVGVVLLLIGLTRTTQHHSDDTIVENNESTHP